MPRKEWIDVNQIYLERPPADKKELSDDLFRALIADIQHQGIKSPISVMRTDRFPGFSYWLADGYSRVRANRLLGAKTILADVYDERMDRASSEAHNDAIAEITVMLWTDGFAEGWNKRTVEKIEELCGPWTNVLPKALTLTEPVRFTVGNRDHMISIACTNSHARSLWLSICRDEQLIQRCCQLLEAMSRGIDTQHLPISIYNAMEGLRTALAMRGRQA